MSDLDDVSALELTILMPCLDEFETLETCISKAQRYLDEHGIDGEVLIADNGSTDGSQSLARSLGARVVDIPVRGYGAALLGGVEAARGRYVVMGDADDSYDFMALTPFVDQLRAGADLVMGNRFKGGIAPGAMPRLHRYVGNPVLSGLGRRFFRTDIGDFHCGLRGFARDSIRDLDLQSTGMEFASEMVVRASLAGLTVTEVPTTLSPDGRSRPPHLRSWQDGWRHLRFLLMFSPRWLFVYPGIVAFLLGALTTFVIAVGPIEIGHIGFDVTTMVYSAALAVIGFQAILFWWLTRLYATAEGFLPPSPSYRRLASEWTLERGLVVGLLMFLLGIAIGVGQVIRWGNVEFGALDASQVVRIAVPSAMVLIIGFQTVMMSFFAAILTIPHRASPPTIAGD